MNTRREDMRGNVMMVKTERKRLRTIETGS